MSVMWEVKKQRRTLTPHGPFVLRSLQLIADSVWRGSGKDNDRSIALVYIVDSAGEGLEARGDCQLSMPART